MNSYLTDQRDRPVSAFVAVVVALLSGGYMLPWAVAALRGKSNHWTIFWINLLGGWTVILWIVALVMAFGSHKTVRRYSTLQALGADGQVRPRDASPGLPGGRGATLTPQRPRS